jgi:hypothetical protein
MKWKYAANLKSAIDGLAPPMNVSLAWSPAKNVFWNSSRFLSAEGGAVEETIVREVVVKEMCGMRKWCSGDEEETIVSEDVVNEMRCVRQRKKSQRRRAT